MTLPISRNQTYSNGTPVEAVDLNDFQDAIVGHKSGPRTDFFGVGLVIEDNTTWTGAGDVGFVAGGTARDLFQTIPLPVGCVVTAINLWVNPGATGSITAHMRDQVISTGATDATRGAIATTGAAHQAIPLVEDLPFTLTDRHIYFYMSSGHADDNYYGAEITWYMP